MKSHRRISCVLVAVVGALVAYNSSSPCFAQADQADAASALVLMGQRQALADSAGFLTAVAADAALDAYNECQNHLSAIYADSIALEAYLSGEALGIAGYDSWSTAELDYYEPSETLATMAWSYYYLEMWDDCVGGADTAREGFDNAKSGFETARSQYSAAYYQLDYALSRVAP